MFFWKTVKAKLATKKQAKRNRLTPALLLVMRDANDEAQQAVVQIGFGEKHRDAAAAHGQERLLEIAKRTIDDHVDPDRLFEPEGGGNASPQDRVEA